ncbi:MAG: hypothetical protein A2Z16_01365 [Chloroflexi bacterium RBG_16_54_18]|nr:MAG: hypothetical protein A2Z16_01365 [Chloroflexi bacterium RBG_16_54_18]
MPKLKSFLQGADLGYLRIMSDLWGLELNASDASSARTRLMPLLLDRKKFLAVIKDLPKAGREALDEIVVNGGQMSWPAFVRKYGELREMGAGKREREKPYASSQATVTEMLFYRAFLTRRFQDTPAGPAEFAILADEWLEFLSPVPDHPQGIFGRPASPAERGRFLLAGDGILDDACTLLAGLRSGVSMDALQRDLRCGSDSPFPLQAGMLEILLLEAGLVDEQRLPKGEEARAFLEASRQEALVRLVGTWISSRRFNELHLLPGVVSEGEWKNDPQLTRKLILSFLSRIPGGSQAIGVAGRPWWSLQAFVTAVRLHQPDFQRQAGEYETWFLKSKKSGEALTGFEHWDQVEGALLRFMIGGPLHWLGIVDLSLAEAGAQKQAGELLAFRFSAWSAALLELEAPAGQAVESGSLILRSNGSIHAPPGTPRAARYQVARFCEWEGQKEGVYRYRLTTAGLEKALQQGLKIEHILGILARYTQVVPPSLILALKHWETQGSQARLEELTVLRLKDPELMKTLRNSEAKRYLGEPLGTTAVVVKAGAWQKVVNALAEMGYFVDEIENNQ